MRSFLFILTLCISTTCFSQSIVGKWKPVSYTLDSMSKADLKGDSLYINQQAVKNEVKNDEEPEKAEKMIRMVFQMMFEAMKAQQFEYTATGTYNEINTRTTKVKSGTYTYDQATKTLVTKLAPSNRETKSTVSWKNGQLVQVLQMQGSDGKTGTMELVLEKLP